MRCASGVKMNEAQSPKDAALAWVSEYGEAFCGQMLDVNVRQTLPCGEGKEAVHLRQFIDGTRVEEPGLRVLVYTGDNRVAYVGGRVLEAPPGGLMPVELSAEDALKIAQQNPKSAILDTWGEPELLVTRDSEGSRVGVRAWKIAGNSSKSLLESWSFYIDASSGAVIRVVSNIAHFAPPDITGTVTGFATPGVRPDMRCPQYCATLDPPECDDPNPPVEVPLELVRVEARDPTTNALLAFTHTDVNGNYTLAISSPASVNVIASLSNDYWQVVHHPTFTVEALEATSISTSSGIADLAFSDGSHPEHRTASVNAHIHYRIAREFFKSRLPSGTYPGLDDAVVAFTSIEGDDCAAFSHLSPTGTTGFTFGDRAGTASSDCTNAAYSMIVAHEAAHHVQFHFLDINHVTYGGFHEGFSDSFSMLLHDQEPYAPDFLGCLTSQRDPLADNYPFPICVGAVHTRGELLGAIWLRIGYGLGSSPAAAQDLFFDWSLLAAPPGGGMAACSQATWDQSADEGTLYEVLTADDNDGNIHNGTPNNSVICDAFAEHEIIASIDSLACSEAVAGSCFPDQNGSGTLDSDDFVLFLSRLSSGQLQADCDGSGELDVFDALCFVTMYERGCAR